MAILNEHGAEVLDDTPVAVPLRLHQPTMYDYVRKMIREQMSREAADNGEETFEEADDFMVGDDYDPQSPYELDDYPPPTAGNFAEEVPAPPPAAPMTTAPEPSNPPPKDGV